MKIEVDQASCIGSGQCLMTAPEVFDQREEDAIVELLDDTPPESEWGAVRRAAAGCPVAAITLHEE